MNPEETPFFRKELTGETHKAEEERVRGEGEAWWGEGNTPTRVGVATGGNKPSTGGAAASQYSKLGRFGFFLRFGKWVFSSRRVSSEILRSRELSEEKMEVEVEVRRRRMLQEFKESRIDLSSARTFLKGPVHPFIDHL